MAIKDFSAPLTETLAASGRTTDSFRPKAGSKFNVTLSGTWAGTALLERSFDSGVTWVTVSKPDLSDASFTAGASFVCEEPEAGVLYSVDWTRNSGSLVVRISQ